MICIKMIGEQEVKCSYCNGECKDNEMYCGNCGQPLSEQRIISEVDNYWKEVSELLAQEDIRKKEEEQKVFEETNRQRKIIKKLVVKQRKVLLRN